MKIASFSFHLSASSVKCCYQTNFLSFSFVWIKVIKLLVLKDLSLSSKDTNITMAALERIGPESAAPRPALLTNSLWLFSVFLLIAERIF